MHRCGMPATDNGALISGSVPGSVLGDCLIAHDRARRARSQVSLLLSRARAIRCAAGAMLAQGDRPWPESAALHAPDRPN